MRGMLLGLVLTSCWLPLAGGLAAAEPTRVAVLVPFVEDALREMPEHARVVAAVRHDLRTPTAEGTADLGNPHDPSLEPLMAARPELVIADARMHARMRDRLAPGGAELVLLESESLEATFEGLIEIGRRVEAADAMQARVDATRAELAELAMDQEMAVLALFGTPSRFLAVTERTWLGDLLRSLRFRNLVDQGASNERFPGYVSVSHEQLAVLEPQLVLVVSHGDPRRIEAQFREQFGEKDSGRGLFASAAYGTHALHPGLFASNPGLQLPEAARAILSLVEAHAAVDR